MPLSKAKMRARKKYDRACKLYDVGLTMDDVKPALVRVLVNGTYKMVDIKEVDAEGNVLPDYD